jgi:cell division protease FtsH
LPAIILGLFFVFNMGGKHAGTNPTERLYSEFYTEAVNKRVESAFIKNDCNTVLYTVRSEASYKTDVGGCDPDLKDKILSWDSSIKVKTEPPYQPGFLANILSQPLTIVLIVIFSFLGYIQYSAFKKGGMGGTGAADKFAQSKAERIAPGDMKTRFTDLAGVDEAVNRVGRTINFLRDDTKYKRMKAKIPRGLLLKGPPGCGKTLLARAIAGEAGVPFYKISGSEFVEMFVGVGASRVRQIFDAAEKEGVPAIIFIDEIDAIGRSRSSGHGNNNDEREQTLNQILTRMDGFGERSVPIIVVAATNRDDILDAALLRPGRFDEKIDIGYPDVNGRKQILKVHMRGMPIAKSVDVLVIAQGVPRASGADLANLVNMAALAAVERNGNAVTMEDFEKAKEEITLGQKRAVNILTPHEKKRTAYHEAGHAIIGRLVPKHDPVTKVTVIPHGQALGLTVFTPETERVSLEYDEIEGQIKVGYGGRVAEEIIYGASHVTTGASGDLQQITGLVTAAITQWGFGKKVGRLAYAGQYGDHLATGVRQFPYSEETARMIDMEKREWTDRLYNETKDMLNARRGIMEVMVEALLKWETIDRAQIDAIMEGKPLEEIPEPAWTQEKEILEESITISSVDEKAVETVVVVHSDPKETSIWKRFWAWFVGTPDKENKK